MPSEQIESRPLVKIGRPEDPDPDHDPAWLGCMQVTKGAIVALQAINRVHESDLPDGQFFTEDYVDELKSAFHVGQKLLDHPNRESISRDLSALDDDLLQEVRATIGYVAPHFEVELSLPAPSNGGDGP